MKFDRSTSPRALGLALAGALLFSSNPEAGAQLPGAAPAAPQGLDQQAFVKGQQLYQAQKYPEAIAVFEGIPNQFPTSAFIPAAYLQIGLCYYFAGDYDSGVAALRKNITGKNVGPEILEDSQALVPQLLSAKAQKLGPDDPGRKPALESAVQGYDEFLKKYPQSSEVEPANYGKARAYFGLERYEDAAQALRVNLQKFAQSESALDTQYMLAVVLGTQATESMRKATAEDKTADAAYTESEKLLREIVAKRSDLAVMNDAQFQLGEILAARGSFTPRGEKQDAVLLKALEAYRSTFPKELVIDAQKRRITAFEERRRDAGVKGDVATLRRYQTLIQREQGKLAELEQRADQTLAAKLKSGQIFLTLHRDKERERMDEARVLFHFVDGFTEDPEQKKQILYFLTLTYAGQHLAAQAEEHYAKWTAAYKDDAMGENLPLLMGAMYLDANPELNQPQKAIEYFKKQAEVFPKSKFTAQAAMQQAMAMIQLKQFPEAAQTLTSFLATNPEKELAAAAEYGLATVFKETGKPDDAMKTFRAVREKYAGTEQAEQASFWVGAMLMGKGDTKGAMEELRAFIAKFPDSELVPTAVLTLGQAQAAAGQKDAALATFVELAAKYPKSEPAPFGFFQRASLLQADSKFEEVKAVMKEFIEKYPQSERVYAAYDYIAQIEVVQKQPAAAVAAYEEFAAKYPAAPQASTAILKVSDQYKKSAEALGRYIALPEKQRPDWVKAYESSIAAAERILEKYPDSPEVALALQNLLSAQRQFALAKIKTDADVEGYFNALAQKFSNRAATASKIKFTLAGYYGEKDKPKALGMMSAAYDANQIYAPADLDLYASALIEQRKYDEAQKIADKLTKDFPLPANGDPTRLPRSVTDPASMAIFYNAKVLQLTGKTAQAATRFEELKKSYPWSPKLAEADFGIATDLFNQKKYDEALKLLGPIARMTTGPAETRARAMMLMGQISEANGEMDAAINNYIKIATFFEGVPELASEGLWRGAQLQEKKAAK